MSVRVSLLHASLLLLMTLSPFDATASLLTSAPTGGACLPACGAGQTCSQGSCVPIAACTSDNDCGSDTRCEPGVGCVGWSGAATAFSQSCGLPTPRAVMNPRPAAN